MYLTSAFGSQVEQSGALRLHRKDHNFRRSGSPSVGNRKKTCWRISCICSISTNAV